MPLLSSLLFDEELHQPQRIILAAAAATGCPVLNGRCRANKELSALQRRSRLQFAARYEEVLHRCDGGPIELARPTSPGRSRRSVHERCLCSLVLRGRPRVAWRQRLCCRNARIDGVPRRRRHGRGSHRPQRAVRGGGVRLRSAHGVIIIATTDDHDRSRRRGEQRRCIRRRCGGGGRLHRRRRGLGLRQRLRCAGVGAGGWRWWRECVWSQGPPPEVATAQPSLGDVDRARRRRRLALRPAPWRGPAALRRQRRRQCQRHRRVPAGSRLGAAVQWPCLSPPPPRAVVPLQRLRHRSRRPSSSSLSPVAARRPLLAQGDPSCREAGA